MALSIIKETIELTSITCDSDGNAFATKRINLQEGKVHSLLQVDMFRDRFLGFDPSSPQNATLEFAVSAYPSIPTNMDFAPGLPNSYTAAGDDSIMFKAHEQIYDYARIQSFQTNREQFPSKQIAASNKSIFYTDHVYLNLT